MRRIYHAIASLIVCISTPAWGHDPIHRAEWMVAGENRSEEVVAKSDRGYFKIGKLVPKHLLATRGEVALIFAGKPQVFMSAGTLLVPIVGERRACLLRGVFGVRFPCVLDKDGDGRYETFSSTQLFSEVFLNSIGDDQKEIPLLNAVDLEPKDPKTMSPPIALALRFLKMEKGIVEFKFCVLTERKKELQDRSLCTRKTSQASILPGNSFMVFGHRIGLDNIKANPATVTVRYPLDDVPFDVLSTIPF
jgi:hypothetical protein